MTEKVEKSNRGRRGRGRKATGVPAEVISAVKERYGRSVRVIGTRPAGGFRVAVKGAPRALAAAMWVTTDGILRVDLTAPGIRRRELAAARRLEAAGRTKVAEKIRARVQPEELTDEVAVRILVSCTAQLAAAREVLVACGHKPAWHRHYDRDADHGEITLSIDGHRLRGGSGIDGEPWFALERGERTIATGTVAEVLAAI